MLFEFYKYQGTGNDFIIIDDRVSVFPNKDKEIIAAICERRMGIGADGLILLRDHDKYDFEMIYFNSDGNQSSMCGNGGRCIVAFAAILGIIENETVFMAIDGVHKARVDHDLVYLKMQDVTKVEGVGSGIFLNTGSPHYVVMVDDLEDFDVVSEGKRIRNSAPFKKKGVNVNFVLDSDDLVLRTYERGVEDETLSCGTGAVALAIFLKYSDLVNYDKIEIVMKGGVLCVEIKNEEKIFSEVWLSGSANMVFKGVYNKFES